MANDKKTGRFMKGTHWRKRKLFWDKEWLEKQYMNKSAAEIGIKFNISPRPILYWLRKHGIKRRTISEARAIKHWGWTEERIKNKIASSSGANSHFWKGGVTKQSLIIRGSYEYTLWRSAVFKRDNWKCVWCGERSRVGKKVVLHADHIKPFALFPDLRLEVSNGRTLCIDCHKKTDSYLNHNKFSKAAPIRKRVNENINLIHGRS